MKYIKYLMTVLFAGALMTSCGETLDVGQTTVEFAGPVYETSFGAGIFYVPMIITSDTEEGMNASAVKAVIAVDESYVPADGVVAGVPDTTGKADENGKMGDFRITARDGVVSFPDYDSYKLDDPAANKETYFDVERNKWVKQVALEVEILNTEPELMEFKLVIESAETTIGAQKECLVVIEKGPQDRLCGAWIMNEGGEPAFETTISWSTADKGFVVGTAAMLGIDLKMNFNSATGEVSIAKDTYLGMYGGTYHCYIDVTDNQLNSVADKVFVAEYDDTNYNSITFPTMDGYFLVIWAYNDNNGEPGEKAGYLSYVYSPSFSR